MSRRTEKVASIIRQVLSQGMSSRLSDPRISPFASITRVEVSGDLMHATVHVSVMGSESDERRTLAGLTHARGYLQSMLAKKLTTRHCPQLRFVNDRGIKKQIETLELIDQISEELHQTETARRSSSDVGASCASEDEAEIPDEQGDVETSPGERL